jgi:hypothetical protein
MFSRISKPILLSILLFLFNFSFVPKVFAAPFVVINSFPSGSIAGSEMEISHTCIQLDPNVNYYIKALGGDSDYEVQTFNSSTSAWLSWNSSWSDMPQIASSSEGTVSAVLKVKFKPDATAGSKNLKIRIRKVGNDTNYDSLPVVINVSTPTPTPEPTSTPTDTPEPTHTPTSTPNPTVVSAKTSTPAPTKSPTPKPTGSTLPTSSPEELVLGIQNSTPASEALVEGETITQKKFPLFPVILIVAGVICIAGSIFFFVKNNVKRGSEKSN